MHALEIGADDYLVKPFSMSELVARVRVAARSGVRAQEVQRGETIEIEELVVDPRSFQAYVDGENVALTPTEFRLLYALASEQGRVSDAGRAPAEDLGPPPDEARPHGRRLRPQAAREDRQACAEALVRSHSVRSGLQTGSATEGEATARGTVGLVPTVGEGESLRRGAGAVPQPRAVLAGLQRARPRAGCRPESPAPRAPDVLLEVLPAPRRVLRGARQRPHGPGRVGPHGSLCRTDARRSRRWPRSASGCSRCRPSSRASGSGSCARRSRRKGSSSAGSRTAPRRSSRSSRALFDREIYPVLTPLAVGPGQPFPYISALSLSLGVFVRDPKTGEERFARVKVPELLPRFISVGKRRLYLPLEHVITYSLTSLFPKMEISECAPFRVTRDADFEVSDEADDLLGSGRAGAAATAVRRHGPRRDLRVDVRRDAEAHQGGPRCARRPGLPRRRAARPRRPRTRSSTSTVPISRRSAGAGDPAAPRGPDHGRRALRRDQARGHPRPPPLRVVRDERRDVRPGRGARSGRDRDQDDGVPHERRVAARSRPDRGRRRRQADRVPRRAEGTLRRAAEHRVVTRAGAIGSARRLRLPDPEDARQDDARRPARGKRACGATSTSAPATTTL